MTNKLKDPHKTVHPFSCGSEYSAWKMRNCNKGCIHYADYPSREACEIEYELGIAFMSHGRVTPEIMDRMGDGDKCPEYETNKRKPMAIEDVKAGWYWARHKYGSNRWKLLMSMVKVNH